MGVKALAQHSEDCAFKKQTARRSDVQCLAGGAAAKHLLGGHGAGLVGADGDGDGGARRAADAARQLVAHALQQAAGGAVQEPGVWIVFDRPGWQIKPHQLRCLLYKCMLQPAKVKVPG